MKFHLIEKGKYAVEPTRTCINCVMDDTDPLITFNTEGLCSYCTNYEERRNIWIPKGKARDEQISKMISTCKTLGKGKKYDCVIGVSGGVDSAYVALLVKQFGLRPLAVHLDNGWNSELAVENISKILTQLDIELQTYVINWEEFKKLQLAFLKASTPDSEIPSDHAIVALMRKIADKHKVPVIWGVNFTSEAILPVTWSQGHMDWGYIKNINKKFGNANLNKYPHYSVWRLIYYNRISRQPVFNILNYIDYDKERAKQMLTKNYGWKDYGGKHYESTYTRIYQSYILPVKFGFDKRKAHFSSLILSGQLTRKEVLEKLSERPYDPVSITEDINYLVKKLGITHEEFNSILEAKPRTYEEFSPELPKKIKALDAKLFSKISRLKRALSLKN